MSLIVPPAADANSFCSVADADAYHAARKNAAWGVLATEDKEASLIKATDYIGQAYGQRWKGVRVSSVQPLDWPRYDVEANGYPVASDIVPVAVANACAELALRASTGALSPDVGRLKKSVTVGPISTTYVDGSSGLTRFTAVDNMLAAYLGAGASAIRVVRA